MLPEPYDDELLYSVLARHADHMGSLGTAAFNQLVFGMERVRPIVELPPRLDLLIPRLLPGSPFNGPGIIAANTLVPYFTVFQPAATIESATAAILRSDLVPAFSQLSVTTLTSSLRIRLCDECVAADRRERRTPYWRRAHQLPGCLVCHSHRRPLRDGPSIRSSEAAGFVSVSRALASGDVAADVKCPPNLEFATSVALISQALLDRPGRLGGEERLARFYCLLRERGWSHGSRLAARELIDHAAEGYGPDILSLVDVHHNTYRPITGADGPGRSTDWLAACLRVRSRTRHPLPYILLMAIAGVDAASLLAAGPCDASPDRTVSREGPCGNVVCPAYDPPVPRPLEGTGNADMVLVTCPVCGFAYRQSPDATSRKRRRIVSYGHALDDAIRHECMVGDATKLQLEQRLGLSTETIKERALELGIWHPRWGDATKAFIEEKRKGQWSERRTRSAVRYRRKWLALTRRHPGQGRLKIGKLDPVTYAFLRTFDREWLDQTTPIAPRPRHPKRSTADADARFAAAIAAAADDLLTADPPVWVTRQAVARRLGKGAIRLDRDRMPVSAAKLAERTESLTEFSARRALARDAEVTDEDRRMND